MEEGFSKGSLPIILGRPFMKTPRTKMDVYAGTLFMEFGDITVHFNILDAMKHPSEDISVFCDEIIDHIVDEYMTDLHPNLHACHSSCIESEFVLDHMSKFDAKSESKFDSD